MTKEKKKALTQAFIVAAGVLAGSVVYQLILNGDLAWGLIRGLILAVITFSLYAVVKFYLIKVDQFSVGRPHD
ncbi:MAG: hypothetical protein LBM23_07755 [Propionibacteriaceae bacterium]|nr:hypothetical protein [Propionibacteriaceae bacterium]